MTLVEVSQTLRLRHYGDHFPGIARGSFGERYRSFYFRDVDYDRLPGKAWVVLFSNCVVPSMLQASMSNVGDASPSATAMRRGHQSAKDGRGTLIKEERKREKEWGLC
jgi:hypothetical protein